MNKDFSELIKYLDKKFTEINEKLEKKADKKDVNKLIESVDAYMKLGERYYQEMTALTLKVDRLEKWLYQIAEKVGIKLKV